MLAPCPSKARQVAGHNPIPNPSPFSQGKHARLHGQGCPMHAKGVDPNSYPQPLPNPDAGPNNYLDPDPSPNSNLSLKPALANNPALTLDLNLTTLADSSARSSNAALELAYNIEGGTALTPRLRRYIKEQGL